MSEYEYLSLLGHQLEHAESSFNTYSKALGRVIATIECDYQTLTLSFENGTGIAITDAGQICCEQRYLVCDDDPRLFLGATLLKMELANGPVSTKNWLGEIETVQFLRIYTSQGVMVVSNHNDGRYTGFAVQINPI